LILELQPVDEVLEQVVVLRALRGRFLVGLVHPVGQDRDAFEPVADVDEIHVQEEVGVLLSDGRPKWK